MYLFTVFICLKVWKWASLILSFFMKEKKTQRYQIGTRYRIGSRYRLIQKSIGATIIPVQDYPGYGHVKFHVILLYSF